MNRLYSLALLFALFFITYPIFADICLPQGNGNTCTAGDFTLSESLISGPPSCVDGEIIPGDIEIRIGMLPTAANRYDIGIFVGNEDNKPVGGGSCTFSSLTPINNALFDGANPAGLG